jgi:hypothetical protein
MMTLAKQLIAVVLLACTSVTSAGTTVAICRLGKKQHEMISVIAEQPIADSRVFSLKTMSEARPHPIFGDEDDASRGARVQVRCVGQDEKVLVLVGEFLGSGYPKGVAIRFNAGQLERIEFAEPGLPAFIDLTPSEMRIAFSRHGPEIAAEFAVYTYVSGAGPMPDVQEAHLVPRPANGIRIPVQP